MDVSQTTCPKCGWVRELGATECPACGIVYARYGGGPRKPPPAEADPFAPPPPAPPGEAVNPYAPPRSNLQNTFESPMGQMFGEAGVWRTGNVLVMQKGAVLPNRCLVCNNPASVQFAKKMYWHTPWLYVLLLLNALIYIIAALIARKKADVVLPLCTGHAEKRKKRATTGGLLMVVGLVAMMGSCALIEGKGASFPIVFFGGMLGLLVGAVLSAIAASMIVPKKIDDYYVWLGKVNASYLATLPPAPPGL